jgi:predicted dehydrogenase
MSTLPATAVDCAAPSASGATYRAGIIGLGFIGGADQVSGDAIGQVVATLDGTHAAALSRHPRVQLVAGSSRDAGRRERFAAHTGARTYADWREMIDKESLDVVSVATYAPSHAEITVECAGRGVRAIYCEKPIATTLRDADRMLAACDAAGALLVINHQTRFNPNFRALRDRIAAGGLGELTSVSLRWPAGRFGNVGTHKFDAVEMLTGRRVTAVSGTLDLAGKPDCRGQDFHDPGGWGVLRFEGGLMGVVDATDYATAPPRTEINGTLATASSRREEVTIEYRDGRQEEWPSRRSEGTSMDRAVGEIVEWLSTGAPFPYHASGAFHALEVIVGFHVSHDRQGAWVDLPLAGADRDRVVNAA